MRKALSIMVLILIASPFGLAQGRDDHDDDGPIQVGYAVVTSVAATTSGLVVFETFGFRRGPETTQAGVLPSDLTTNALMFVTSSGRLSRNLGVAIVNPNSSSVNVAMTLRRENGTQLATTIVTVGARQQTSQFITELFSRQSSVPSDFTGTLVVTSTTPVGVIGLRFRGPNFSTLPVTSLSAGAPVPAIASGVGGPGAVLLPQFAAGGGWASQIVIANTGTTSLTARLDLFKPDGTPLSAALNGRTASSFLDLTIPANGVLVMAPRNPNGDDDF